MSAYAAVMASFLVGVLLSTPCVGEEATSPPLLE
jgi:hypothetical protein